MVESGEMAESPPVGREGGWSALEAAWTRARLGRCVLQVVAGEWGIGKTVLVDAFLDALRRGEGVPDPEPVWMLRVRCSERDARPLRTARAWMEAVRDVIVALPVEDRAFLDGEDLAPLVRLFPMLGDVLGTTEDDEVDPGATDPRGEPPFDDVALRRAAMAAGAALLRAMARVRPVVVGLDDAQWGDASSARMIARWADALSHSRFLVLVVGRSGAPFIDALERDRRWVRLEGRQLDVGRLGDDAIREIVEASTDDPEVVEWAVREAAGHPGMAVELVRSAGELSVAVDWSQLRFVDVLRGRLQQLDPDRRRVLLAVCLCERPVPARILTGALGSGAEQHVQALVRTRWLGTERLGQLVLVEAVHPRIVHPVVDSSAPGERARLHRALADSMRRAAWGDAELLVEHYLAAGAHDKVGALAMEAAEDAVVTLAYDRAVGLYRTALAFVSELDRPVARRALAEALALAGRGLEAADAFEALAEDVEGPARIVLIRRAAEQALYTGHVDRGIRRLDDVLVSLGLPRASEDPGRLETAALRIWSGVAPRIRWALPRADPLAVERVDAAFAVAIALQLLDPPRAAAFHLRALGGARALDDRFRIARSRCLGLAMQAASIPDWERFRTELSDLRTVVDSIGSPYLLGLFAVAEGVAAFLDATYRAALRVLARAERRLVHASAPFELTVARVFRVRSLVYAGQLSRAGRLRDELVADGRDRGDELLVRSLSGDVMALLDLAAGRPDAVRDHVVHVMESWSGSQWSFQRQFALRAEILRLLWLGRGQAAWEASERLLREVPRLGHNVVTGMQVDLLRGRAVLARVVAGGDVSQLAEVEMRAQRLEGHDHRLGPSYAGLLRASTALVREEPDDAVSALQNAIPLLDRADLGLHVAVARLALARLTSDARAEAAARGWMHHEGVDDPAPMCRVFVPGLDVD